MIRAGRFLVGRQQAMTRELGVAGQGTISTTPFAGGFSPYSLISLKTCGGIDTEPGLFHG